MVLIRLRTQELVARCYEVGLDEVVIVFHAKRVGRVAAGRAARAVGRDCIVIALVGAVRIGRANRES